MTHSASAPNASGWRPRSFESTIKRRARAIERNYWQPKPLAGHTYKLVPDVLSSDIDALIRGKILHVQRDAVNSQRAHSTRQSSLRSFREGHINSKQLKNDVRIARRENRAKHVTSSSQLAAFGDSSFSSDDCQHCRPKCSWTDSDGTNDAPSVGIEQSAQTVVSFLPHDHVFMGYMPLVVPALEPARSPAGPDLDMPFTPEADEIIEQFFARCQTASGQVETFVICTPASQGKESDEELEENVETDFSEFPFRGVGSLPAIQAFPQFAARIESEVDQALFTGSAAEPCKVEEEERLEIKFDPKPDDSMMDKVPVYDPIPRNWCYFEELFGTSVGFEAPIMLDQSFSQIEIQEVETTAYPETPVPLHRSARKKRRRRLRRPVDIDCTLDACPDQFRQELVEILQNSDIVHFRNLIRESISSAGEAHLFAKCHGDPLCIVYNHVGFRVGRKPRSKQ